MTEFWIGDFEASDWVNHFYLAILEYRPIVLELLESLATRTDKKRGIWGIWGSLELRVSINVTNPQNQVAFLVNCNCGESSVSSELPVSMQWLPGSPT